MSYNISNIAILKLDAEMEAAEIVRLYHSEDLAECNFVLDHLGAAESLIACDVQPKRVKLRSFDWRGGGSGNSWDLLKTIIAPKIHGVVEAIVTWEGGDSVTGLRIRDGVVTEPKVRMTLEEG